MKYLIFSACGVFAICASVFDWDFFMNHRKAQFFVNTIGRTGARIFYFILGVALLALGILMAAGIVAPGRR